MFCERLARLFAYLGCLVCLRVARLMSVALQHTLSTCTILKATVNSFFPFFFCVQCRLLLGNRPSLATAPLQKPRSPHSRWKRFLFCFSLVGKVRGRLASGIVAEQLENSNSNWPNSTFLSFSSKRNKTHGNKRKVFGSLYDKCWQKGFILEKTAYSHNPKGWGTHAFVQQLNYLLGESSWLDKMQSVAAHLKCWNCWKGEIQ